MWPNPQFSADLVTFTEEILNGKYDFLCSGKCQLWNLFHSGDTFQYIFCMLVKKNLWILPLRYVVLCLSLVLSVHLLLMFSQRFWNHKSCYMCLRYLHQGNWTACFHFQIQSCIVSMDLGCSGCLKTVMIVL